MKEIALTQSKSIQNTCLKNESLIQSHLTLNRFCARCMKTVHFKFALRSKYKLRISTQISILK